ncbi:hypothetical protein ACO0QE_002704 [Hanseniaspora vineae]
MSSAFRGFSSSGFNFFNASQNDNKDKPPRLEKNDHNAAPQRSTTFHNNKGKSFSNNKGLFLEGPSNKGDGKKQGSFSTSKEKSPVRLNGFSNKSNSKTSYDQFNRQKTSSTKQNFGAHNFKSKSHGSFQSFDKKGNPINLNREFNVENFENNVTAGNHKTHIYHNSDSNTKNKNKNKEKKIKKKNEDKLILRPLTNEKENTLGSLLMDPDQNGFFKRSINQRELPKFMVREKAQLVPTEFKQDQWDKANQLKMLKMEQTSSGDTQDLYDMFRKMRVMERKMMENKKLVDKAEESKDLSEAIVFQGTCLDMCPIFERTRRSLENNVSNLEKVDGKISRERAIKAFARPAASAPPSLPSDVRPPHVLMKTLDYIVGNVIGNLPEGEPFLWDRMRSIRQDFTYQNYCGPEAVDCNERICRIHLLILHIMAKSNTEYSKQQEFEQLTKALITLCEIYDDARHAGLNSPNEPEFRAYWLLHNVRDSECDYVIQNLPLDVINNKLVQLALAFRRIVSNSNFKDRGHMPTPNGLNIYTSFFRLLSDPGTPFLMASFLENYVNEIRFYGFLQIKSSTNKKLKPIPFQFFMETFRFNNFQEVTDFCQYYSIEIENSDHVVIQSLKHNNHLLPEKSPFKQAWLQCVDEKMTQLGDFSNIINVGKSNFDKDYLIKKHFGINMSQTPSVEDLHEKSMVENAEEQVGSKLSEPIAKLGQLLPAGDSKANGSQFLKSTGVVTMSKEKSLFEKETLAKGLNEVKPFDHSSNNLSDKTAPVAKLDLLSKDASFGFSFGIKREQSTTPTPQARDVSKATSVKPLSNVFGGIKNVSTDFANKPHILSKPTTEPSFLNNHAKISDMSNNISDFNLRRVTDQQQHIIFSKENEKNEEVKENPSKRQLKSTSAQQLIKHDKFSQEDLTQTKRSHLIEKMGEQQIMEFCHQEIESIIKDNMAKYQVRESKLNLIAQELYTAFLREQLYMSYLEARADLQYRKCSQRRWLKRWQVKLQQSIEHKNKAKQMQTDISIAEKNIGVPNKRCVSLDYFLKNQAGPLDTGGNFGSARYDHRLSQILTPIKNEKREISLQGCSGKVDLYQTYLEPILKTKQKSIKYCNLKNVEIDISIFSDNWKNESSKWLYENMNVGLKMDAADDLCLSVKAYDSDHCNINEQCNTQLLIFNTGVTSDDIFDLESKLKKDGEMLISLLNNKSFMKNHYKFNILLLYWESVDTKYDVNELYDYFQLSRIFEIFGETLVKRVDFLKLKNKKSIKNLRAGLKEIALDFKFDLTSESGLLYFENLKKKQRQDEFSCKRLISSLWHSDKGTDGQSQDHTLKKNKIDAKLQKMLKEEQLKYAQQKTANHENTFQFMKRYPKKTVRQNKSNRKVSVLHSDTDINESPSGVANFMHPIGNIAEEGRYDTDDGADESLIDSSYHSVIGPSKFSGKPFRFSNDSLAGAPVVAQLDERARKLMRNLTFNYNGKEDGLLETEHQRMGSEGQDGNLIPSVKTPTFETGAVTPSTSMKRPVSHLFTPTILSKNFDKSGGERSFSSMRTPSSRVVSINRLINGDKDSFKGNREVTFSNAATVRKHKQYGKRISSVSSNSSSVSELKNLVDSVVKKLENV